MSIALLSWLVSQSIMNQVQILHITSMRWILNYDRNTPIKKLLKDWDFLSIYQLTIYFSLVQYGRVNKHGVPTGMKQWIYNNAEGPEWTIISGAL